MKKVIVIALCAVLLGGMMGYYFFNNKDNNSNLDGKQIKIQAFQIGVFSNYDNANKSAVKNNGVVVRDGNIYRVYVSLLRNSDALLRMENYFKSINLKYYLKDVYVDSDFYNEIVEDENLIISSEENTFNTINKDIISKYEDIYDI